MDEELHPHRIISPDLELPRCDETMDVLSTLFFVESAIDHALRTRLFVFDHPMPVNLKLLEQKLPHKKFFDSVIGKAISHKCAISLSSQIAKTHGFALENWSQLDGPEFRNYTKYYLDVVRSEIKPVNLTPIHMLSFAIVLTAHAVEIGNVNLMINLIWCLVHKFGERFPYEWIYNDLHRWAIAYNMRHATIHETWAPEDFKENGLDQLLMTLSKAGKD